VAADGAPVGREEGCVIAGGEGQLPRLAPLHEDARGVHRAEVVEERRWHTVSIGFANIDKFRRVVAGARAARGVAALALASSSRRALNAVE